MSPTWLTYGDCGNPLVWFLYSKIDDYQNQTSLYYPYSSSGETP